jgi:6-phosphogluconate dehydrogenase
MKIAMIGLGKMGRNLALNLLHHQHQVIAYDVNTTALRETSAETGITGAYSFEALCAQFAGERRLIWLMVPAGNPSCAT